LIRRRGKLFQQWGDKGRQFRKVTKIRGAAHPDIAIPEKAWKRGHSEKKGTGVARGAKEWMLSFQRRSRVHMKRVALLGQKKQGGNRKPCCQNKEEIERKVYSGTA